jgi:outer membrane receptor protein involved in Fe transport
MASRGVARAVRLALASAGALSAGLYGATGSAQEAMEEIVITGTRIEVPGTVSSSPIYSVGSQEIRLQQQPEVEKILRILPIIKPADGANVNNGTAGVATVNLRGLGAQRNLILMDGKRLTPYNVDGIVDTSVIPTALIDRIDIVTGGASAVYGSDAISGALNFIMKKDFEGIEFNTDFSQTGESDGDTLSSYFTLGANVADGRGNVVLSLNYTDREAVLLGARPLGQLGIETSTGAGYAEYLAGEGPTPPPTGCEAPSAVASGGSTTTMPTRTAIAGGPGLGQYRNDRTLGSNCSVFNFNPFNFYQTPQKRYGAFAMGSFEIDEHAEAYARLAYTSTVVRQQVAPSGFFGNNWWTPLSNPYIGDQARQFILTAANAGVTAGTVVDELTNTNPDLFNNWRDLNANGVVDVEDDLNLVYRRRTLEIGARSEDFDNNNLQFLIGFRGDIMADWRYDLSYQFGQSNRTTVRAGYTNVANAERAITGIPDPENPGEVICRDGASDCVPIDLFGGFGTITPEMARYSGAVALQQQRYEQKIVTGSVNGPINAIELPWAGSPLAVSIGAEYRDERGETIPDECLRLAPESCQGGAGGYLLPIKGGFTVKEVFGEALFPLASGLPLVEALDLELGYRYSDYDPSGSNDTWKVGLNWRPHETLLIRAMQQKAARAPNVGELASPVVSSLDNATLDPCSIANAGNITPELDELCRYTGMSAAQVGTVENIVSGQINIFDGTDPDAPPETEDADTTTIGFVWTPNFANLIVSLDYYDISIDNYIDTFKAQEVLDGCYSLGLLDQCDKIIRVGGTVTLNGSGVELLTTNLINIQNQGLELSFTYALDIGEWGGLTFAGTVNQLLKAETQTADFLPVLDCKGYYGTSCEGPQPELSWVQRTTWDFRNFSVSYLWRHIDSVSVEPTERANTFESFRNISSFDYFDLYGSWQIMDQVRLNVGVTNLFDESPPVVGNEAADTSSNSGNTFPSTYDVLGRAYTVGINVRF